MDPNAINVCTGEVISNCRKNIITPFYPQFRFVIEERSYCYTRRIEVKKEYVKGFSHTLQRKTIHLNKPANVIIFYAPSKLLVTNIACKKKLYVLKYFFSRIILIASFK